MTNRTRLFLIGLFSLAAIGLVKVLQENPTTLILSIVAVVGIVYLVNRFINKPRGNTGKGYQKALRSQKKKEKLSQTELQKLTKLKKTSRNVPFRVIEGRKGKSAKDKEKDNQTHFH